MQGNKKMYQISLFGQDMDRYQELLDLVATFEKDFFKFYEKGNKAAGIRLRKNMQDLRKFSKSIRAEVQMINKQRDIDKLRNKK